MSDIINDSNDELAKFNELLKQSGLQLDKFASRSIKSIVEQFANLDKSLNRGSRKLKDIGPELENLKDAIEDSVEFQQDSVKKKAALDRIEAQAREAYVANISDGARKLGTTLLQGFANYYINQLKIGVQSALGSDSPFKVAADLQIAMYDSIAQTSKKAASGMESTGAALMAIPTPASKVAGALLMLSGGILDFVSSKSTELLKFKTEILSKEVEKSYDSFKQATSAGVLFANGLTELRATSSMAGLTQEQFTKVIADNADILAQSGLTMTSAASKLGSVTGLFTKQVGTSGKTLRDEMLSLGYSIEEQTALTIDIISDLKRTGARATNAEIASATAEYAKNLKLISNITGEDARKRIAQAKAATEDYNFMSMLMQQAKDQNDPGLVKRVQAALSLMTADQQRFVKQAYVLNGVVPDVAANITGLAEPAIATAAAIKQGGKTIEGIVTPFARFGDEFQRGGNRSLMAIGQANAATDEFADIQRISSETLMQTMKLNSDTLRKGIKNTEDATNTNDDFTGAINESVVALQQMKIGIQDMLTGPMKKFASDVPEILAGFRDKLIELGLINGQTSEDQKIVSSLTGPSKEMYAKALTGKTVEGNKVGFWEQYFNTLGAAASPTVGIPTGKAKGGISSGPISGYGEVLHGTEAVVPLPDNRTIPVSLDSSALTNSIERNNSLLQNILSAMKESNTISSGILKHTM